MPDKKISDLPSLSTLSSSTTIPCVDSGDTFKATIGEIAASIDTVKTSETKHPASGTVAISLPANDGTLAVTKIRVQAGVAYTLAAGTHGMKKVIVADELIAGGSPSSTVTISGAISTSTDTITFTAVGQTATLSNIDGSWYVLNLVGATAS